jgi:hypothetical protein
VRGIGFRITGGCEDGADHEAAPSNG